MSKEDNPILVEWLDSMQPMSAWMFLSDKPNLGDIERGGSGQGSGLTYKKLMGLIGVGLCLVLSWIKYSWESVGCGAG